MLQQTSVTIVFIRFSPVTITTRRMKELLWCYLQLNLRSAGKSSLQGRLQLRHSELAAQQHRGLITWIILRLADLLACSSTLVMISARRPEMTWSLGSLAEGASSAIASRAAASSCVLPPGAKACSPSLQFLSLWYMCECCVAFDFLFVYETVDSDFVSG